MHDVVIIGAGPVGATLALAIQPVVVPAKAGTQGLERRWAPASAGATP